MGSNLNLIPDPQDAHVWDNMRFIRDWASGLFRLGTVGISVLGAGSAPASFTTPFTSTSYLVFLQPQSSVAVSFWPSSQSLTGFTLNVSAGGTATFNYFAIQL